MELKTYFAQDESGNVLGSATCFLYLRGTEHLVSGLQKANGVDLPNPFETGPDGLIQFSAPDGLYDLRVNRGNRDYRVSVQLNDVGEALKSAEKSADRAADEADRAEDAIEEAGKFVQIGEGSVVRKVADKLQETISISDKGAVGDGLTNCAEAIIACANSTTGTIIVPAGNFVAYTTTANSDKILDALERIQIDGKLTIYIGSGTHRLVKPVRLLSAPGRFNSLKILGAPPVGLSITGQVSVSGSAGNFLVVLGVSSTAGIAVGDYLHTTDVVGTGIPEIHRGCWEVRAVDAANSRITVRNTCFRSTFAPNTITSSTSVVLKSIMNFIDCDGFVVPTGRLDYLDAIAVVGNSDDYWLASNVAGTEKGTHGFVIGSNTIAANGKPDNVNPYGASGGHVSLGVNVGVCNFDQQGVVTELTGSFYGNFLSCSNNKRRGTYASTATGHRAKHVSLNGNYLDGGIVDIGGKSYSSSSSCAVGNGKRGITAGQNGVFIFDSGVMSWNGSDGSGAVSGGTIQATGAKFDGNLDSGAYGEYGSKLIINDSVMDGNAVYAVNALVNTSVRAQNCVYKNNVAGGVRSTEQSCVVVTGSTFSGNIGPNKSTRGDGQILDDTTYTLSSRSGIDFRSVTGTTGQGARFAATSGGDDFIIGHDTGGSGTYSNTLHVRSGTGGTYPDQDNSMILGRASNRFSQVFAGTGVINTSDAREKTPVRSLTEREVAAASLLTREVGVYKWLASVQAKGADARNHIGMTVQRAIEIMTQCELDPYAYGFICFDSWDESPEELMVGEDGTVSVIQRATSAGDRYSFRMDELKLFMAAGLEARLSRLESL